MSCCKLGHMICVVWSTSDIIYIGSFIPAVHRAGNVGYFVIRDVYTCT